MPSAQQISTSTAETNGSVQRVLQTLAKTIKPIASLLLAYQIETIIRKVTIDTLASNVQVSYRTIERRSSSAVYVFF